MFYSRSSWSAHTLHTTYHTCINTPNVITRHPNFTRHPTLTRHHSSHVITLHTSSRSTRHHLTRHHTPHVITSHVITSHVITSHVIITGRRCHRSQRPHHTPKQKRCPSHRNAFPFRGRISWPRKGPSGPSCGEYCEYDLAGDVWMY